MLKEFKEFAIKGNVVDMAVGIMIGGAFSTVTKSLVDEVLMPPIGLITGGLDFTNKFIVLRDGANAAPPYTTLAEAKAAGATVIGYGSFINSIVSFMIIAIVLFFLIRWINRLRRPDTPPAPSTKACPYCKSIIDLGATRCAHCTSELSVEAAPSS